MPRSKSKTLDVNQMVHFFLTFKSFILVKYISYNAELLFAASSTEIRICKIQESEFKPDSTPLIDAKDLKIRTINPGLTIHALFLNKFCISDKF